ncbi:MAG: hypothetical protein ABUL48_02565, partial [Pseudorhodoplanes sp.]
MGATDSVPDVAADYLNFTTTVSMLLHSRHSNVRKSWSRMSGSIRASIICAPHLEQGGRSIKSDDEGAVGEKLVMVELPVVRRECYRTLSRPACRTRLPAGDLMTLRQLLTICLSKFAHFGNYRCESAPIFWLSRVATTTLSPSPAKALPRASVAERRYRAPASNAELRDAYDRRSHQWRHFRAG